MPKRVQKGHEMGETLVSFGDKSAMVEPLNAARIGSGFICVIKGHKIPFNTFAEAVEIAFGYVFGKK